MSTLRGKATRYLALGIVVAVSFATPIQAQTPKGCPAGQVLRFYVEAGNQYQPDAIGTFIAGVDDMNNAADTVTPPGSACPGGDPDDEWIIGSNFTGHNDTLPLSEAVIPAGFELKYVSQCFSFVDGVQWGPSARHVSFVEGAWHAICKREEFYMLLSVQNAELKCENPKMPPAESAAWFNGLLGLPTSDILSTVLVGPMCFETPQDCTCGPSGPEAPLRQDRE